MTVNQKVLGSNPRGRANFNVMIKIINPNDLIIKEIENDEFLMSLINEINENISDLKELPNNGIKFNIVVKERITVRHKNLLMYIFSLNGWALNINFMGSLKDEENHYGIFLIEQKKVYLN